MSLDELKDVLSLAANGITKQEAFAKGICINCKQPDPLSRCSTQAGQREYQISGMCEECFDKLFGEEEQ